MQKLCRSIPRSEELNKDEFVAINNGLEVVRRKVHNSSRCSHGERDAKDESKESLVHLAAKRIRPTRVQDWPCKKIVTGRLTNPFLFRREREVQVGHVQPRLFSAQFSPLPARYGVRCHA